MNLLFAAVLVIFAGNVFAEEHALFTSLLGDYVKDGHVGYAKLCRDARLGKYIQQLSSTDPSKYENAKDELSFWLNAYNAYTLQVICEHYPVKSINELHSGGLIIGTLIKGTIWDKKIAVVDGEEMSLNHIEHDIVRKKFRDPRVHFALVCASVSCPALRAEAYEGDVLDRQLNDQAKIFFEDRRKSYFDVDTKTAHLSKILDWYSDDFGGSKEKILEFIARFLPADVRAAIVNDPSAWKIRYASYDWALNE